MRRRVITAGGAILASALGATLAVQAFASSAPPTEDPGADGAGVADVLETTPAEDGTDVPADDWDTGPLPPEDPFASPGADDADGAGAVAPQPETSETDEPEAPGASPGVDVTAEPDQTATPTQASGIPVTLVFAERRGTSVAASGFADVVELGGTCELTVVGPAGTFTATGDAEPDATTTSCGELVVTDPSLADGAWTATLTYSSPASQGVSPAGSVVNR